MVILPLLPPPDILYGMRIVNWSTGRLYNSRNKRKGMKMGASPVERVCVCSLLCCCLAAYHKNSVYPLSGIGAWQLCKWVCAMMPRDQVIINDAKISSFKPQFSCGRGYEGRVNCRPSKS